MRLSQSALSIAVLLAVCQIATAQEARRTAIDGKALADGIHDFVQELRDNVARDVTIWRERSQKMRQEVRDRLNSDEATRRRLLSTTASGANLDLAHDIASKSWELILDAGGAIKNVVDAKKVKIHEFFADILGGNWASFLPNLFTSQNFSWDSLGLFDYRSNIQDLVSLDQLHNFQMPQNLGELYAKLDTVTDAWCNDADHIPPEKIPTTCEGPSFTLSYIPKSCIVKSVEKTVVCDPAKLVMVKTPGECTLKHNTAFEWVGKQCRYKAEIGLEKEKVIGGGEYPVDLTDFVHDKVQDIVNHVKPDAPVSVTTAPITSQPFQRIVIWTAPEKASLQTVLKYVVTCTNTGNPSDVRTVKVAHDARDAVIGSAATGDNRALSSGATYVCAVAAQNLMGTGAITSATDFTTSA